MNAVRPETPSRIIVSVGVGAAADAAALTLAVRFAHASGAELAALFIEDVNLLRVAELPFAVEISPAFASSRPLTISDLERSFRQQADRLRQDIADFSQAVRLRSSFTVARGMLVPTLLGAAVGADLVVLACKPGGTAPQRPALDVLRAALRAPLPRATQPVVTVLQSAGTARRMLAAAHQLADGLHAQLVVLIARQDSDGGLAAVVEQWASDSGARARVHVLPRASEGELAALIARENPQGLLWPGDGETKIMADARLLLSAVACPLIVVR